MVDMGFRVVSDTERRRIIRVACLANIPVYHTSVVGASAQQHSGHSDLFAFNAREELQGYDTKFKQLNDEQLCVFNRVTDAIESGHGGQFYLDGPGGSGKSHVLQCLLHYERKDINIPIATASTGIASTLLSLCRTLHSRFRVPIQITAESICNITKQSSVADLLRDKRVRLVIVDEAPMLHRFILECLDRTLRS